MHTERSFVAPKTFPDAHIERWAPVFLAPENHPRLRARQVKFETFLLAPEVILAALVRPPRFTLTACGLLPAQAAVQRRVDLQEILIEMAECAVRMIKGESHCANGAWTEKLKHHAWPRHRGRRTITNGDPT
jgi:hypothetical protein